MDDSLNISKRQNNYKMKKFPTLYKRNSTGSIQEWTVVVDGNQFWSEHGVHGGSIVVDKPTVCEAKNIGKKNETTPEQQAELEAQAKFDKKLRQKHFENIKDIDEESWIQPILAKPFKNRKKPIIWPVIMNIKYNGVRCIIKKDGAFSRKGEEFHNIEHIKKELAPIFKKYPDLVLDGELYNEDLKNNLNRLIKLVAVTRKPKDISLELRQESEDVVFLYVYDGYFEGKEAIPYEKRYKEICGIINPLKYCVDAKWEYAQNETEVKAFADKVISEGNEGAILRIKDMPYQHKRSHDLLKIKKFVDAEFEVVDIQEGSGNWAGCAKIITCKLDNGETFDSNVRGTMEHLKEVLENKEKYIGEMITVEFQEYSEYGVPLIPYTDLIIRSYE